MLAIAQATAQDLESIRLIDSLAIGDTARTEMLAAAVAAGHCWLARIHDVAVGFAVLDRSFFGRPFVELLIVHPEYRRRGVATGLLRYCEAICPSYTLFTSTNESNTAMQEVLRAAGYERSGYIANLDEGDPEIIYVKHLRDREG